LRPCWTDICWNPRDRHRTAAARQPSGAGARCVAARPSRGPTVPGGSCDLRRRGLSPLADTLYRTLQGLAVSDWRQPVIRDLNLQGLAGQALKEWRGAVDGMLARVAGLGDHGVIVGVHGIRLPSMTC
jgi:hypothetical protein